MQIVKELQKYAINQRFKDWTIRTLQETNQGESLVSANVEDTQRKALAGLQNQMDILTKMRYRDLITDEEFIREREALQNEITKLEHAMKSSSNSMRRWNDLIEKAFEFVCAAPAAFQNGDVESKKAMLLGLGENFTLKDKKLFIDLHDWLIPIAEHHSAIEEKIQQLEPEKNLKPSIRNEIIASLRLLLCALVDDVRATFVAKNDSTICIPSLPHSSGNNSP